MALKRLLVLALFCLGNGVNEMMQLSFSPVFAATQAAFGVSAVAVTALPTIYLAAFAPAALALALLRTRLGLRACLLGGAALQALGAWGRFAACAAPTTRGAFALLAAGQAVAALAQPVFTNLPAALAATWFSSADRALATVAATLANPIGNALGSVVPGLVVPDGASPAVAAAALARITLAQAVVASLVAAAVFALVDDAPAEPPSAAAALRRAAAARGGGDGGGAGGGGNGGGGDGDGGGNDGSDAGAGASAALLGGGATTAVDVVAKQAARPSAPLAAAWVALLRDAAALVRNRNFCWLLVGFALGLGVFNALISLLGQLLAPCGYSPATAGLAGGAILASGLLTAIGAGFVLRLTGAFVPALRVGIAGAAVAMVGFLLTLRPHGEIALLVAATALGAAAVPLLPLALENAAEATHPIAEDASAALLTAAGKLCGVVFVVALQPLAALSTCATVATPVAAVVAAVIAVAAGCLFAFRVDYRRVAAEAAVAAESASSREGQRGT
jgi:hypothetical protein